MVKSAKELDDIMGKGSPLSKGFQTFDTFNDDELFILPTIKHLEKKYWEKRQ